MRIHNTLINDQALYFVGYVSIFAEHSQSSKLSLIRTMNRMFLCNAGNFVVFRWKSSYMLSIAVSFSIGFPCVMGTRVLLNLKKVAREEARLGISTEQIQSPIEFGPAPGGSELRDPLESAMDEGLRWFTDERGSGVDGEGGDLIELERISNEV